MLWYIAISIRHFVFLQLFKPFIPGRLARPRFALGLCHLSHLPGEADSVQFFLAFDTDFLLSFDGTLFLDPTTQSRAAASIVRDYIAVPMNLFVLCQLLVPYVPQIALFHRAAILKQRLQLDGAL
jgi:hypothetical protein